VRRLLAALPLLFLAACSGSPTDTETTDDSNEPTWSVACAAGAVPIADVGELELDCLGDGTATAVGTSGKPLVVVLWASWCLPCQDEAPEIEAFFQANSTQVDVLGVDTGDTDDRGRWFAQDFGMTYPSVADPDEAIRTSLGVPALPGIALVAPDGTVEELIIESGTTTESLTEAAEAAFGLELA
jgi:thiol-disulfide isomerase/thioredoxin